MNVAPFPIVTHSISYLMKNKKLYTKLLLAGSMVFMGVGMTSCEDFLTVLPTNQMPEQSYWQDKSDLEGVRAAAYAQLSDASVTSRILYWGELRSDDFEQNDMAQTNIGYVMDGILQPTNGMFDWASFYTGINYCNLVLEQGEAMTTPGKEVDPSFSRADWNPYKAEMTALRALFYFYLVRSYRDVPYITDAVRNDQTAREELPAQEAGVAIMGQLISEVDSIKGQAATNFGTTADNCGRFTKRGVRALLADMYLWRGCMLKNFMSKTNHGKVNMTDVVDEAASTETETVYKTADGTTINTAYTDALAKECFQKAKENADWVISDMKREYDEDLEKSYGVSSEMKNQQYPLLLNSKSFGTFQSDNVYGKIFGSGNSSESIFEIQYDASTKYNSTLTTYLSNYSSSTLSPKYLTIAPILYQGKEEVDPSVGYGKTDYRLAEAANINSSEGRKPITKFLASSVFVASQENVLADETSSNSTIELSNMYSLRTLNDSHWAVYRLTDVMLIKAEAIARLEPEKGSDDVAEGFQLCNQIFKRNNPKLVGPDDSNYSSTEDTYKSNRAADLRKYSSNDDVKSYRSGLTAAALLTLVYHERQREFFAEGKRWYDIVRQVEASNDPKNTMTDYITVKNSVKQRLTQLYAFYNPIYSEELKVNGPDVGGKLVQNPVWDRYTKK